MHNFAKELMCEVKDYIDDRGTDILTHTEVCTLKEWTEIARNITSFEKDYLIIEAMKEKNDNIQYSDMLNHVRKMYMDSDIPLRESMKRDLMNLVNQLN